MLHCCVGKLVDGRQIANGVYLKKYGDQWITSDRNGTLLSIIDTRDHQDKPLWFEYIEYWLSSQHRFQSAQPLIDRAANHANHILVIGPSLHTLAHLLETTEASIDVVGVHQESLRLMVERIPKAKASRKQINILPSQNLNIDSLKRHSSGIRYDVVVCLMVLDYIEDYQKVLREMSSIAKHIVIGVHRHHQAHNKPILRWDGQIGQHCSMRGETWCWTQQQFVNSCVANGMTIDDSIVLNNSLYISATTIGN